MPANGTFTELVTTTLRNHRKGIKDNITNRNALLKKMYKNGNYRTEDGGLSIVEPLDYAANGTYQRYSGWDRLNIEQSDVLSAAEFAWKQIAMNVVASGLELRVNSGDSQLEKLATARIKNMIRSFENNFSSDLYSAGSLSNQIGGLQAIVADTNTNSIGGIDANTWTFWRNTVYDFSVDSVTPGATTIEPSMLKLWLQIDRGPSDQPDLIIMSTDYYTFFETSQTSIKRYASAESAQGGFVNLKYKNADVIYDTSATGIPSAHVYMLNTTYLKLVVHEDADMEVMPKKESVDQDGEVIPLLWQGNLTVSNRKLQGVMIA